MKLAVVALTLITQLRQANCQETSQQLDAEFKLSEDLAVKLYPDCSDANSPLSRMITKMDHVLKSNNSSLYDYTGKPLILAVESGALLKIQPNWLSVTEGEKEEVFGIMEGALVTTRDLTPSVASQAAPAQDTFNPGSMNNDVPANNPPTQSSAPVAESGSDQSSIAGFHCYLYSLEAQSSGLKSHMINSHSGSLVYSGGPLSGMTKTQANEYAIQMWQQMSPTDQMAFENQARTSGDPIAQQQAAAAAAATRGPTGATIYNSDGTVSQVQYH